jgi:hypothetical protein
MPLPPNDKIFFFSSDAARHGTTVAIRRANRKNRIFIVCYDLLEVSDLLHDDERDLSSFLSRGIKPHPCSVRSVKKGYMYIATRQELDSSRALGIAAIDLN